MTKKNVKKSPSKLWAKAMHRVIYDLLTEYSGVAQSLSTCLEEIAAYVREETRADHRSPAALSTVNDLQTAATTGMLYGWQFGIAGARLRVTTEWTDQTGRRLARIVKHAARAGYQIGLRQRAGLGLASRGGGDGVRATAAAAVATAMQTDPKI